GRVFLRLLVEFELEALGEQSLQHRGHVVFGGAFGHGGHDVEALRCHAVHPIGRNEFVTLELVGGADEIGESEHSDIDAEAVDLHSYVRFAGHDGGWVHWPRGLDRRDFKRQLGGRGLGEGCRHGQRRGTNVSRILLQHNSSYVNSFSEVPPPGVGFWSVSRSGRRFLTADAAKSTPASARSHPGADESSMQVGFPATWRGPEGSDGEPRIVHGHSATCPP